MEAPMSDAPETIWACYDPQDKTTYWAAPDNPYAEGDLVGVYRRADLPPTPEQIMADPRVGAARMALESAQESIATFMGLHRYYLDSGAGDVLEEINAALAALAAKTNGDTHE
jgi:hypothetical protein